MAKALDSIRQQSGTVVTNDLGDAPSITNIRLNRVGFWEAAESVARAVKGRVSVSSRDGSVRLVRPDPSDRDAPASYQGPFRVRVVRVSSTRDLTSDSAQCVCSLELNWTANLRPLFVEEKIQKLQVRDARDQVVEARQEGSGLIAVDGRFSYTADLTLAAFPRSDAAIKSVQGQFLVVAPSKFLTFRFSGDLPTLARCGSRRCLTSSGAIRCGLPHRSAAVSTRSLERRDWA